MSGINIAVVEDEGIVAMDLKRALTDLGYGISFIVESGEKALEMLKEYDTDLVIMDIVLKGKINGVETARRIFEEHEIPIVFLTAFEDDVTKQMAMTVKNYGFIIKPFEDATLKIIIDEAVKGSEISDNVKTLKYVPTF